MRITVRDHGIGIQEDHMERIFDPYFTTKQKGSGLGLAVTHSIVRNHGGCISVRAKPGAGATFTIHLPAADTEVPEQHAAPVRKFAGAGRVLIMDDEDMVRDVLRKLLKYIGYDVEAVKDGAEAIAAYEKARETDRPFDAVIIDLTVPGGMGGKEAIEKLRQIDPGIKAIVSSGYSNDPIMANHQDYGFKEVITKPYTVINLGNVLQKVLAGS